MSSAAGRRDPEHHEQRDRQRRTFGLVALALVLVVVGGGTAFQFWRTHQPPGAAPAVVTATPTPAPVAYGRPILLGRSSAPVRVRLYEDFHCPHCAEFESELGPTLTAEQDSGTVAVELYPMSFIDEGSDYAANGMACATEAGFGQTFYLGLFADPTLKWSDDQLIALAGRVSTSVPASFDTCVRTRAHQDWAGSINAAARTDRVTSTPTLFLDGRAVDIAGLTPDRLRGMIETAATQ